MPGEQVVLPGHASSPTRILLRRAGAAGVGFQFQPALVVLVTRLKEHRRLGGMDEHGKLIPGANLENPVEARIVDMDALALAILQIHTEVLEDFQALCSVFHVLLELRGGAGGIIRIVDALKIDISEYYQAIFVSAFLSLHQLFEIVAIAAA